MNWVHDDRALPRSGFPIRRSPDQSLLSGSPGLFAASHVLRRLLAPRHPPCALSSLTMIATRHVTAAMCHVAIAWASYHALALRRILPVQSVKDRRPGTKTPVGDQRETPGTACTDHQANPGIPRTGWS